MKKHCSIIVLYNPNSEEISNFLNQLIKTKYHLFIIDNSEKKLPQELDIFINESCVTYICFKENKGLAFAQNRGLKEAISRKFYSITLFDQDSFISSKNYKKLVRDFRLSKFDIMSPLIQSKKDEFKVEESLKINRIGWPVPISIDESKYLHPADIVIASGLTCSLKIFEEVGFFKNEYFIDYLDIEWCLRARNKEKKIVVNSSVILFHTIGIHQENYWVFKPQAHQPERTFYQFRNNLALFREEYIPKLYCFHELLSNLLSLSLKILLKRQNRRKHLLYFWNAIKSNIPLNKIK